MANVFDDLITQGVRRGQIPGRSQKARKWFRDLAKGQSGVRESTLFSDRSRVKSRLQIGEMYMFRYKAKWAKTLPYYDRFPLIFPLDVYPDGFLGMNLHYLPHRLRAKLMDELYDIVNNENYDDTTKLRISYQVLNRAGRFRFFKPCIKRYLYSQLESRFIYVYPAEWDIALFLPLENFTKSNEIVWRDSRNKID